jgi:hypothetical protein
MIKKLSVNQLPSDPPPEAYKNMERPVLSKSPELSMKDLDDLKLDIDRLPSLKVLLKEYKTNEMNEQLNEAMSKIIQLEKLGIPTEESKKEIVVYVMEEIEKFLLKPKSGREKKQMAVNILKKMFYDDELICGIAIDGLMVSLRQVGTIRRLVLKLFRYCTKKGQRKA